MFDVHLQLTVCGLNKDFSVERISTKILKAILKGRGKHRWFSLLQFFYIHNKYVKEQNYRPTQPSISPGSVNESATEICLET